MKSVIFLSKHTLVKWQNKKKTFIVAMCLATALLAVFSDLIQLPKTPEGNLFLSLQKRSVSEFSTPFSWSLNLTHQDAKDAAWSTGFPITIKSESNWIEKLAKFQVTLARVRDKFMNNAETQTMTCPKCNNKTTALDEFQNLKYRITLKTLSGVKGLIGYYDVSWFDSDEGNNSILPNLPVQRVFKLFATQPVCHNLPLKTIWSKFISCNSSKMGYPETLSIAIMNTSKEVVWHSPRQYSSPESLISYVSIFANASINAVGSVSTCNGCFTFLPYTCRWEQRAIFVTGKLVTVVDEVFTIAQFWGSGYFHAAVENLPRLAPFVEFLQKHPHIRLHVALNPYYDKRTAEHMSASLAILGIDPARSITGHVRARIAYVPRGTTCGFGLRPEMQILSWRFHKYIANNFSETEHSSVVLIVREASKPQRNMARSTYTLIEQRMRTILNNGPLKLELFDDRHRLSHPDTLRLFYRARIVIGIHGAGLSNMIYSRPGTQVIEMLCQPPDNVNLCYANTALILGHRYPAFPVENCTNAATIDTEKFITVLESYIRAETMHAELDKRER